MNHAATVPAQYTRRTSVYTITVSTPAEADAIAAALTAPVSDHGPVHVSARLADDDAAREVFTATLAAAGHTGPAVLSTGLGVHRREVEVR